MKLEDRGYIKLSESRSIEQSDCRYEMSLFRQMINDHQKGVKAMGRGKICNEIHGNGFPILTWNFEWVEVTIGSVLSNLIPLTEVT